jgi:hypothetical protein
MQMQPVVSDNVLSVGYDSSLRTMRVQFHSGLYEYYEVDISLFESMLLPHPWRRVGRQVKVHRYNKIA